MQSNSFQDGSSEVEGAGPVNRHVTDSDATLTVTPPSDPPRLVSDKSVRGESNFTPSVHPPMPENSITLSSNSERLPFASNQRPPGEVTFIERKVPSSKSQLLNVWREASSDELMLFLLYREHGIKFASECAIKFCLVHRPGWLESLEINSPISQT